MDGAIPHELIYSTEKSPEAQNKFSRQQVARAVYTKYAVAVTLDSSYL